MMLEVARVRVKVMMGVRVMLGVARVRGVMVGVARGIRVKVLL